MFLIREQYLLPELSFTFVDLLWIGVRRCVLAVVSILLKLPFYFSVTLFLGILGLVF